MFRNIREGVKNRILGDMGGRRLQSAINVFFRLMSAGSDEIYIKKGDFFLFMSLMGPGGGSQIRRNVHYEDQQTKAFSPLRYM